MSDDLVKLVAVCEKASQSKFPVTIDPVAVLPVVREAAARIEALEAENARLRARDSGGFAPDGKTWKEALFDEAEKRGVAEARTEKAESALAGLQDNVHASFDKWSKALGWGLIGIQPECWALMDSAVEELVSKRGALAEAVESRELLHWLTDQTHLQLSFSGWDEADVWEVYSVTGGRNDREWHLIASGTTPTEALRAARAFVQQHEGKK